MKLLITGGSGYIGSHTCLVALENGYDVVVVDNLSNSHKEPISRVEKLTEKNIKFYQLDVCDFDGLQKCFLKEKPDAVIHFAGLKAVGEGEENPLKYYKNNVQGTITLLEVMRAEGVKNLIFSSSATVYGEPKFLPYSEKHPLDAMNVYGQTKLFVEDMCRKLSVSDPSWNIALLRYFNPIGAHPSGEIGEDPNGIPNNLLPYIAQVAVGKRKQLSVFGADYDTQDGTGVRDYIHVMDLAEGHIKAVEKVKEQSRIVTYNLGTGKGYSVFEVIKSFEEASGKKIPYEVVERRPGDLPAYWADASLAKEELNWQAEKNIDDMTADTWNWQRKNPNGYM